MPIIPWKHFGSLWDRFFEDEDWAVSDLPRVLARYPAVDVYETDKEVVAEVNVPGIEPENIDISVKDHVLRVAGRTEEKKEEKGKDYWRKEISRGSFERVVRLPSVVNENNVDATYEKGVLKIVMKKLGGKARPGKKINIKVK